MECSTNAKRRARPSCLGADPNWGSAPFGVPRRMPLLPAPQTAHLYSWQAPGRARHAAVVASGSLIGLDAGLDVAYVYGGFVEAN